MLQLKHERWFRGCAGLTAFLTLWFAAAPAYADVRGRAQERGRWLEEVAGRLGLDPDRMRGGDASDRAEGARIARKRADALARLRARTESPGRAEEARRAAAAVEEAQLAQLLGGAAQVAGQAHELSRRLADSPSAEERAAVKASLRAASRALE